MQSKAKTVKEYLASLPEDRRAALETVRKVILANLDKDYEEGMQYGMIGYYVPHRVYPAGYHCDPKQPLPFAGLASQKNHMSLYLMCVYGSPEQAEAFRQAWEKTGRKLDMGKSCVRFKRVEDLALNVIGETIKRSTVKRVVAHYEAMIRTMNTAATAKAAKAGRARIATRSKTAAKTKRKAATSRAK
jgi:hypothetical protein